MRAVRVCLAPRRNWRQTLQQSKTEGSWRVAGIDTVVKIRIGLYLLALFGSYQQVSEKSTPIRVSPSPADCDLSCHPQLVGCVGEATQAQSNLRFIGSCTMALARLMTTLGRTTVKACSKAAGQSEPLSHRNLGLWVPWPETNSIPMSEWVSRS